MIEIRACTDRSPGGTAASYPASEEIVIRGTDLGTGGQVIFRGIAAAVRSWSPPAIVVVLPVVTGTGPLLIILNPRTGAEARTQGPDLTVTTAG